MPTGDLEAPDYVESIANELLAKFRRLDTVIAHAPSRGTYHEKCLRKVIRDYLPSSYEVGEGFIINQAAKTSTQMDILIVDTLDPRSFGYKEDNFFIASDLAVTCFGEVKTMPTKVQFIKSFQSLVNGLQLFNDAGRVTSFLFCYDVSVGQRTFFAWIRAALSALDASELKPWHLPDYIFCLKKGIMQERRNVPGRIAAQYFDVSSRDPNSNIVQSKIIVDLLGCVTNGCGRLRMLQGIQLLRD